MYEGNATKVQKPAPKPARSYSGKHGTRAPCCEQAKQVRCVCEASWSCPVHGMWCVGSHS